MNILKKLLWQACAHLIQPATIVSWYRTAFRHYWRKKSPQPTGRPPIRKHMQALIRWLSRENWLWSAEQIRDTLINLDYDSPCEDTVRKYMSRPKNPEKRSATWLPFLRNHLDVSWAIDFFTVPTLTFKVVYIFLVFDHGRRKVLHFATTYHPAMNWVIQQLREAMPFGEQPRYMFRDNDGIYGTDVKQFLDQNGIEEVRIAYRSPRQSPYIERFVGTLRRELLDHAIVLSQAHLDKLLKQYINDYYHVARPHQGLDRETPIPQGKIKHIAGPTKLISIPVVGGLHHRHVRVAA